MRLDRPRAWLSSAWLVTAAVGISVAVAPSNVRADLGAPEKGSPTGKAVPAVPSGLEPTATTTGPRPERGLAGSTAAKRAVVIGVGRYRDPTVPPLPLAAADAQSIYEFLTDPWGGAIPPSHVTLLLDEQATRSAIRRAILDANEACKREETGLLLLYFAGHGARGASDEDGTTGNLLVPFDARLDKIGERRRVAPKSALPIRELERLLAVNEARSLVLLLDACFSGAAGGRTLSPTKLSARQAAGSDRELQQLADAGAGRAVLTATSPNEAALEVDQLGHGLFTYALLDALRYDANRDGVVTVEEAASRVQQEVAREARRLGRGTQTPTFKLNRTAPIALRVLPRTHFKLGLKVDYGDGITFDGSGDPGARPALVQAPLRYGIEVSAWDTREPLTVYLLRFVNDPARPWSERLLPDGENALAPRVTVSDGRPVRFPTRSYGARALRLPPAEQQVDVLYVLAAAPGKLDRDLLDRIEARVRFELLRRPAAELARRAAAVLEREPALLPFAIRYLTVQHRRKARQDSR